MIERLRVCLSLLALVFTIATISHSPAALAQAYGRGSYADCQYQNCTTDTSTGAASGSSNGSPVLPGDDQTPEQTNPAPSAGSTDTVSPDLSSEVSSVVRDWWLWIVSALGFMCILFVLVGVKRRRSSRKS